jgi:hypothetical protein
MSVIDIILGDHTYRKLRLFVDKYAYIVMNQPGQNFDPLLPDHPPTPNQIFKYRRQLENIWIGHPNQPNYLAQFNRWICDCFGNYATQKEPFSPMQIAGLNSLIENLEKASAKISLASAEEILLPEETAILCACKALATGGSKYYEIDATKVDQLYIQGKLERDLGGHIARKFHPKSEVLIPVMNLTPMITHIRRAKSRHSF